MTEVKDSYLFLHYQSCQFIPSFFFLSSVRSTFSLSKALGKQLALGILLGFIFADEVLTLKAIVLPTIQLRITDWRSRKQYFLNGVCYFLQWHFPLFSLHFPLFSV